MEYSSKRSRVEESGECMTPEMIEEARARAWCHVYDVYSRRLAAYFRKAQVSEDDVEDLVRDTLANTCAEAPDVLALTWDDFMRHAGPLISEYKKRDRRVVDTPVDICASEPEGDVADAFAAVECEDWAEGLRLQLSGRQQAALWHCTMMGLCAADAAMLLGCKAATVRVHVHRGVVNLQQLAERHPPPADVLVSPWVAWFMRGAGASDAAQHGDHTTDDVGAVK